jgi:hypothetical protein
MTSYYIIFGLLLVFIAAVHRIYKLSKALKMYSMFWDKTLNMWYYINKAQADRSKVTVNSLYEESLRLLQVQDKIILDKENFKI